MFWNFKMCKLRCIYKYNIQICKILGLSLNKVYIKLKRFLFVVVQSHLPSDYVIFQPNLCLSLTCSSIHLVTMWRKNKSCNLTKVTVWRKNKSCNWTKVTIWQKNKNHSLTKEQKSQFGKSCSRKSLRLAFGWNDLQ